MVDRGLIEGSLPPIIPTPVAHYTSLATLPALLPVSASGIASAWATPVQFLNDRSELELGLQTLQRVAATPPQSSLRVRALIDSLLSTLGRSELDAYQMSFSGNCDDVGQWRGYADAGMGCAVLTDSLAVQASADVAGWVLYRRSKQQAFARKVLEGLRGSSVDLEIEQTLVAAAGFMKDEGFGPEREYRLICFADGKTVGFRPTSGRLVPYIDFLAGQPPLPLQQVTIGPGWQLRSLNSRDLARNHVMLGIRRLLDARGLGATAAVPSAIPFDPR